MKWSVIIPTLWKPLTFPELLHDLNDCDWVDEIILIDNNPRNCPEQATSLEKVIHVPQAQNIYVNPAWNLGVQLAKNDWICICNDDVLFDCDVVFSYFETRPLKGITGIHPDSCDPSSWNEGAPIHSKEVHIKQMWACLFFLPKAAYEAIPDDLKIWWGDAWLAWHARPSRSIITKVITEHSESVKSPEFEALLEKDTQLWDDELKPWQLKSIEQISSFRNRVRRKLHRIILSS